MVLRRDTDGGIMLCLADNPEITARGDTLIGALSVLRDHVELYELGDPFGLTITGEF